MRTSIIVFYLFVPLSFVFGQNQGQLYVEPLITSNQRMILMKGEQGRAIKEYESPVISCGLNFNWVRPQKSFAFSLGYYRGKFGSKRFEWPKNLPIVTPQYQTVQHILVWNQALLGVKYTFLPEKKSGLYLRYSLGFIPQIKRRAKTWDSNGEPGIGGLGKHSYFEFRRWEHIVGAGYSKSLNIKFIGKTVASIFTNVHPLPMRTNQAAKYFYLPIDFPTKGILWNFGFSWAIRVY